MVSTSSEVYKKTLVNHSKSTVDDLKGKRRKKKKVLNMKMSLWDKFLKHLKVQSIILKVNEEKILNRKKYLYSLNMSIIIV